MIVWSGRGYLIVLVLILSFVLLTLILQKALGIYIIAISFFITGAFSWFLGKKWNNREGKIVIDKSTGQELELKPNHTLFWIKMQYWGIIFVVLGLLMLVLELL